mmetsp:Transcript_47498/g.57163  ORF Transcript_47498/g.57163 Transcript_47498/m.57163 type:complete len:102 (+) Transcript_47498:142-447(+)
MPGYLNKSQVPPIVCLRSIIKRDLSAHSVLMRHAQPTPDNPAPTTTTSKCSELASAKHLVTMDGDENLRPHLGKIPGRRRRLVPIIGLFASVSPLDYLAQK